MTAVNSCMLQNITNQCMTNIYDQELCCWEQKLYYYHFSYLDKLEPLDPSAQISLGAFCIIYRGLNVLFPLMEKWLRTN